MTRTRRRHDKKNARSRRAWPDPAGARAPPGLIQLSTRKRSTARKTGVVVHLAVARQLVRACRALRIAPGGIVRFVHAVRVLLHAAARTPARIFAARAGIARAARQAAGGVVRLVRLGGV